MLIKKHFARIIVIILAGIFFCASPVLSEDKVSTDIVAAGVGARPLAMGKAFTAVADDCNAIFLNPAGLAYQENWELTSLSTRLLDNVNYSMVGGKMKTKFGTVGVGYLTVSSAAGYTTSTQTVGGVDQIVAVAPINYSQNVLYLSIGRRLNEMLRGSDSLGDLSVGASLKVKSQGFSNAVSASASGYDANLALLWKFNPKLSLGLNAHNVLSATGTTNDWSTDQKEKNNNRITVGSALKPNSKLSLALDADLAAADGSPLLLHAGAEFKPVQFISLRAGLDQDSAAQGSGATSVVNNLTGGVGIEFKGFKFDYAYHADATFNTNSSHYFSLSFAGLGKRPPVVKTNEREKQRAALRNKIRRLSAHVDGVVLIGKAEIGKLSSKPEPVSNNLKTKKAKKAKSAKKSAKPKAIKKTSAKPKAVKKEIVSKKKEAPKTVDLNTKNILDFYK
ncbi:hypothetical protein ACFL31_00020 [Candidatus Margulisiibacteriota bacterium]